MIIKSVRFRSGISSLRHRRSVGISSQQQQPPSNKQPIPPQCRQRMIMSCLIKSACIKSVLPSVRIPAQVRSIRHSLPSFPRVPSLPRVPNIRSISLPRPSMPSMPSLPKGCSMPKVPMPTNPTKIIYRTFSSMKRSYHSSSSSSNNSRNNDGNNKRNSNSKKGEENIGVNSTNIDTNSSVNNNNSDNNSNHNHDNSNNNNLNKNNAVVLCGGSNGTNYFSSYWSSGRCTGIEEDVRIVTRRPENYVPFTPPIVVTEPGDMIDASIEEDSRTGENNIMNSNSFESIGGSLSSQLSSLSSSLASQLSFQQTKYASANNNIDLNEHDTDDDDTSTYSSGPIQTYTYDNIDNAVNGASSIWLSAPVSGYQSILNEIMPALTREGKRRISRNETPLVLMIMYAQGGVDWMTIQACKDGILPPGIIIGLLKNFPSLIKTVNTNVPGYAAGATSTVVKRHVTNLGFHPDAGHFAAVPSDKDSLAIVSDTIRKFLPTLEQERGRGSSFEHVENILAKASSIISNGPSPIPHVHALPSPLLCTLGAPNQFLHPAAIAGFVGPPPGRTFSEVPYFYKGNDPETFTTLANIWCESLVLSQKCEAELGIPGLFNLFGATRLVRSFVGALDAHRWPLKVREWFASGAFRFSARLHAARLPVVPANDDNNYNGNDNGGGSGDVTTTIPTKKRLRFDTESRAIVDDIGHGLVVLLGIAHIVGQDMPRTMELVLEQQVYVKKEFVVFRDGKLVLGGRDLKDSGAPQAYGVHDLEGLRDLVLRQKINTKTTTHDDAALSTREDTIENEDTTKMVMATTTTSHSKSNIIKRQRHWKEARMKRRRWKGWSS